MSRRGLGTPNSLDLLLDTICNTFGSVLFLAILVSVILRTTSSLESHVQDEAVSAAEWAELTLQDEIFAARLESLRQTRLQQGALTTDAFSPTRRALMDRFREASVSNQRLRQQKSRLTDEIAEARKATDASRNDLRRLESEVADAHEKAVAIEQRLQKEFKQRERIAALPVERATSKAEVAAIVRYQRLYMVHQYDDQFNPIGYNEKDFVLVEEKSTHVTITPKVYGGLPLDAASAREDLITRLRGFAPERHYIAVFVFDDSFEIFEMVKRVIVELGFEYRLVPMATGEILSEGSVDSRVQ